MPFVLMCHEGGLILNQRGKQLYLSYLYRTAKNQVTLAKPISRLD